MNKGKFDGIKLAALWKNRSGKGWGGRLGDARVLLFENTDKRGDKSPDMVMYLVPGEPYDKDKAKQHREEKPAPAPGNDDQDNVPF